MKCPPIEIPDQLASALDAGELVIFAGAGVSIGPPAKLGNFQSLAETIARNLGVDPPGSADLPNRFLARLKNEKHDVHEICRGLFAGAKEPNEIHRLLLGLFRRPIDIRLVTSNFDPLFSVTADELHLSCTAHLGPALPLGDDFNGIVHLHGSALGPASQLILTADDFGRAYMTRGWARRFLLDLYSRYTVLFVGYRHGDFPLEYLAFGLRGTGSKPRYALDCDELERWRQFGITPISYERLPAPAPDPHANLIAGLRSWVEEVSRSPINTEVRLDQILHATSEPSAEAEDFLLRTMLLPAGAGHFVHYATDTGLRWVEWLDAKGKLKPYLHFEAKGADLASSVIARWIGHQLAHSEEGCGLSLVERHDGRIGDLVWDAIAYELARWDTSLLATPEASRWVIFLLSPVRAPNLHALNLLLQAAAKQKLWPMVLHLIGFLTTPTAKLLEEMPTKPYRRAELSVALEGDIQQFILTWQDAIVPSLPDLAPDLAPILETKLHLAHQIALLGGKADSFQDPALYTRTAIEFDEHPVFARGVELLLNLFAEVLNALHQHRKGDTRDWAQRLLSSSDPILLRFGLYVLKQCTSLSPTEKVQWLSAHGLFNPPAYGATHELYELLKDLYPHLTPEERSAIWTNLEAALPPPADESPESQQRRHEIDKVCWYLSKENASDPAAAQAWGRLKTRNPELAGREPWKPGEFMRDVSGTIGEKSPRSVTELLSEAPSTQVDFLLEFKGGEWPNPTRVGLFGAIAAAAREKKEWGSELMRTLVQRSLWTSDIWAAIFTAHRWGDLSKADQEWFLSEVAPRLADVPDIIDSLARFLFHGEKVERLRAMESRTISALLTLSTVLWRAARNSLKLKNSDPIKTEWLNTAINRSPGWISGFWITHQRLLIERLQDAGPAWPKELIPSLGQIVSGETDADLLALSLLIADLALVRRGAPAWTSAQLYPCFDFGRLGNKAWISWVTFVCYGTWDRDVALELKPLFQAAFPKLSTAPPDAVRPFLLRVAAMAASGFFAVNADGWLAAFLHAVTPPQRAVWTRVLANSFSRLPPDERRRAWDTWFRSYWSERLAHPVPPIQPAESEGFLSLAIAFKEVFADAVSLLVQGPTPDSIHFLPLELAEGDSPESHPEAFLKALNWVLAGINGYFLLPDRFKNLYLRLPKLRTLLPLWDAYCQNLSKLNVPDARELSAAGEKWFTQ